MKACFSVVMMIAVMTVFAWGQNDETSADEYKYTLRFFQVPPATSELKKEIEIMKGILGSELASLIKETRNQPKVSSVQDVSSPFIDGYEVLSDNVVRDGFYLQGQGAVFIISMSVQWNSPLKFTISGSLPDGFVFSLPGRPLPDNANIEDILEQIRNLQIRISEPGARHEDMVAARAQINALQSDIRTLQDTEESLRPLSEIVLRQAIAGVRESLVDTLAKYGDSLTSIKPDEYINLVFQTSPTSLSASGRGTETITVRKSWITDYKAGKMTLDEFRKKALPQ